MKRNYQLTFMLLFVAFGALIVITTSAVTYKIESSNMQEEFLANASSVIGIKHDQFEKFFNRPARSLEFIAQDKRVQHFFKEGSDDGALAGQLAQLLHGNSDLLAVTLFKNHAAEGRRFGYDEETQTLTTSAEALPDLPMPQNIRITPQITRESTAFALDIPVREEGLLVGFIRALLDFDGVAALLEGSPAGRIHLSDSEGNFLVYRDRPLPPDEAKSVEMLFPGIAEELLFSDLYVGEKMYARSIRLGESGEFKLFLEMNDAILTLKKEAIGRVTLYLILGVLLFSLPVAYMFALVPKRLNEEIVEKNSALNDLNATLNARVKEAVEANRQKDRIMFNQSKNAAMGEMISMITHQWRQPLSSISALASKLKLMATMGEVEARIVREEMQQVITASVYLSRTIEDFKDFFKPDRQKQNVMIEELIEETLRFSAHPLAIHSIEVTKKIQNAEVTLYKNELIQVLMNLVKNSIDQLALSKVPHPAVTIDSVVDEKSVTIRVSDNAGGIDKAVLPRIFEEYFTAKEGGTGLGLYMSRMIIDQRFGGKIEAENIVDDKGERTGARFRVTIPL